jgi:hypothetical protein
VAHEPPTAQQRDEYLSASYRRHIYFQTTCNDHVHIGTDCPDIGASEVSQGGVAMGPAPRNVPAHRPSNSRSYSVRSDDNASADFAVPVGYADGRSAAANEADDPKVFKYLN